MTKAGWLRFVRQYGPIARADNMYDETIQRSARRANVAPIYFQHPAQDSVLACFDHRATDPVSVILTGTAGDGKTHLCRRVWEELGGDPQAWAADNPYLQLKARYPKDRAAWPEADNPALYREITIHFIRDLSGWAPQQGLPWDPEKELLLQRLCRGMYDPDSSEVFLIAGNDGQVIESWRRLNDTEAVVRVRRLFEDLLVEDRQQEEGARLRMFNLSRWSSAELFNLAYSSFVNHVGWDGCYEEGGDPDAAFGPQCPIRRNLELLRMPLVKDRLHALIALCDHNGLHIPIRQIVLMLTNAVFGHPDCNCEHLLRASDVPKVIRAGTVSKASLYNNVFGGNLPPSRRQDIAVFDYLERFQIGYETTNRLDNILIFGEGDPDLDGYFKAFLRDDHFYGADGRYFAARDRYVEGAEDDLSATKDFLDLLVAQRRGLFFKIPAESAEELRLWTLTVFRFAGEYLAAVVDRLRNGGNVPRGIVSRLVKGLNRIFTGMLINSEREVFLATSASYSQGKISRILIDRLSVDPRHGERVAIELDETGRVVLALYLSTSVVERVELTLIRYEFLSRVATEGALPASFSKECYEDILAFKTKLLAAYERRMDAESSDCGPLGIRLLNVNKAGAAEDRFVEVVV